jgi:predicted transcriptional regulator
MKKTTNFRLTEEAIALLDALAKARGISRTAMLEIIIREAARREEKAR